LFPPIGIHRNRYRAENQSRGHGCEKKDTPGPSRLLAKDVLSVARIHNVRTFFPCFG
jgi:hypothetical protein